MRLPYMRYYGQASQKQLATFGGYNRKLVVPDNEFKDMKNMTSDFYPAIGTRRGRGNVMKTLSEPNGIFYKNGLMYVDGTALYYKDSKVGEVEDSEKTFVGMGAYVLIWPDKVYYNTHTGEFAAMVKTFKQTATATFSPWSEGSALTKIEAAGLDFSAFDSVTISGCTNEDFNKTTVIQAAEEGYIVVAAVIEESFTQASGLTVTRDVPDMDFVCESNNRLWGCSSENHEIYASMLGNPLNWNNFEGIASDSYAVTVGSDGDFTGCIAHLGNVLFFKENTIHKMYGNRPSNFELNTYTLPGVQQGCSRSLCIVDETLYYKARKGICSYDGSVPNLVSDVFGQEKYSEACANQYESKYYVSMLDENGNDVLMAYAPKYQLWHKEDGTRMKMTAYGEGELYYVDGDNNLRLIASDESEEKFTWMLQSGELLENTLNMKYISKLMFHVKLDTGAKMEIYLRYDAEPQWERKFTIHSARKKSYMIPIIPRRCSQFEYRIEGRGGCKLYGISKYVEEGSEIDGNI